MSKSDWWKSRSTFIWIFNVGRGLSVFIRTGLNQAIMYDFGSSEDFSPADFIAKNLLPRITDYDGKRLAQTVISHPHADHISEIEILADERSPFHASLLTCPHDKEPSGTEDERLDWSRVNNPDGTEEKVELYRSLYEGSKRNLPLQTIGYDSDNLVGELEYGIYYIRPPVVGEIFPTNDQEYTNGVSIVLYYRFRGHSILIPGDLPPAAMEHLLFERSGSEKRFTVFDPAIIREHPSWHDTTGDQPSLRDRLKSYGLTVLLAPHHGLESGFSEALYECLPDGGPDIVVISEKRHTSEVDGKVDSRYQSEAGARGLKVWIDGEEIIRNSVTTRDGHHILAVFPGTGVPRIYGSTDPRKLVQIGG